MPRVVAAMSPCVVGENQDGVQAMKERIEWNGGECPVPPETKVRIFLRKPVGWHGQVHYARDCWWEHDWDEEDAIEPAEDGAWHIIAYEVVPDDTPVDPD